MDMKTIENEFYQASAEEMKILKVALEHLIGAIEAGLKLHAMKSTGSDTQQAEPSQDAA